MTLMLRRLRERADGEGLRHLRVEVLRGKMPGAAEKELVLGPTPDHKPVSGFNKVMMFCMSGDCWYRKQCGSLGITRHGNT